MPSFWAFRRLQGIHRGREHRRPQHLAISTALAMDHPIGDVVRRADDVGAPVMIDDVLDVMTALGMTTMCVTHEMGFGPRRRS
jgi:ABC-type polar amino acid transport system ATPase subunit